MDNNYILRKLRYALDFNDFQMLDIFKKAEVKIERAKLCNMLRKEEDEGYAKCDDRTIGHFLDGLIIERRGKQEPKPGQKPPKPQRIDNNMILRKLKIAFELNDEGMIDVFKQANFSMSKPQLSGMFRRKGHRNYDECSNQYLRTFVKGLTISLRPSNPNN